MKKEQEYAMPMQALSESEKTVANILLHALVAENLKAILGVLEKMGLETVDVTAEQVHNVCEAVREFVRTVYPQLR